MDEHPPESAIRRARRSVVNSPRCVASRTHLVRVRGTHKVRRREPGDDGARVARLLGSDRGCRHRRRARRDRRGRARTCAAAGSGCEPAGRGSLPRDARGARLVSRRGQPDRRTAWRRRSCRSGSRPRGSTTATRGSSAPSQTAAGDEAARARALYDHGYLVFWAGRYELAHQRFTTPSRWRRRSVTARSRPSSSPGWRGWH